VKTRSSSKLRASVLLLLTAALSAIPALGQQKAPAPVLAPKIISLLRLKNQTIPINEPQLLFTPAADGLFRVRTYLSTPRSRAEQLSMTIIWVDNYGELQQRVVLPNDPNGEGSLITIRTKAQNSVLYYTYFSLAYENQPLPSYDITSVVERLTSQ
jgi:hypothetical protein